MSCHKPQLLNILYVSLGYVVSLGRNIYKYAESNSIRITQDDFRILDKGFIKTVDRKLAEALYVKEMGPVLNIGRRNRTIFFCLSDSDVRYVINI